MNERENVQIVKRIYAAFGIGDLAAILNLMADDVDWLSFGSATIPWAGRLFGHKGVEQFFKAAAATFDVEVFQPEEFLDAGDTVVVLGHERMKVRATGRRVQVSWAHIWKLHQGRVVRLRDYTDTAAWEVGLSSV